MKIRALSVSNFLSFSERGIIQNRVPIKLGDFNLFIGKNNTGKSNILRILDLIKIIFESTTGIDRIEQQDYFLMKSIESRPINFEDWYFYQDSTKKMEVMFELEIDKEDKPIPQMVQDEHAIPNAKDPVLFLFRLKKGWPKIIRLKGKIEFKQSRYLFRITGVEIPNDHGGYPLLFDEFQSKILFLGDDKIYRVVQVDKSAFEKIYKEIVTSLDQLLSVLNRSIFRDHVVYIAAIRKITGAEANPANPNYQLDTGVVKILDSLRDGRQEEKNRFIAIKQFLRNLIYPEYTMENIEITFPLKKRADLLTREMEIDICGQILPISHFGSGVEQLLAMATEVVRHGAGKIVLIEEPEVHFHPDLQRKFIRFLKENNEELKHQYLIASHSNVYIDEFLELGGSIFYIKQEQEKDTKRKYSLVEEVDSSNLTELLSDLGVKSSDILHANGIIWIEGQSDKIYLKRWMELYYEKASMSMPIEGKDCVFLCYGGSLLKYLSVDPNIGFWKQENSDYINTITNLLCVNRNSIIVMDRDDMDKPADAAAKWKAERKMEIKRICDEHGIMAWLTEKERIENYLPDRFTSRISTNTYKENKVKKALEIEKELNVDDLNVLDLEVRITEIMEKIKIWNR